MFEVTRYHDISVGHTVCNHESKCAHLHGHNYRIWFHCIPNANTGLDSIGRVIDFSVIKEQLCMWLEENWDHKFLVYYKDPRALKLSVIDSNGVVIVPFNPTAENMAEYLCRIVAPERLVNTGVTCNKVLIEETAKCHAGYTLQEPVVGRKLGPY